MNQQPFQFRDIGSTEFRSTNHDRIITASTINLVGAPTGTGAGTTGIVVYQIDYDLTGSGSRLIIGDNAAVENSTDRIFLDVKTLGSNTIVYPQGISCRAGKALAAQCIGGSFDGWVRVTYMQI